MSPRLHVVKPTDTRVVHTCSCKKTFTLSAWSDLPLVGFDYSYITPEESGEELARLEILEQRNCTCGSSRAISIELPRVFALANEQARGIRKASSVLVAAFRARGDLPVRDPEVSGPAELVYIEREGCAQEADKMGANLRLLAFARRSISEEAKAVLLQRAELCDELATTIRGRT